MKDWQPGDKVEIPLTKSVGCVWERSMAIKKAIFQNQNYLYICSVNFNRVELSIRDNTSMGEKFLVTDIKPYSLTSPNIETILESRRAIQDIHGKEEKDN